MSFKSQNSSSSGSTSNPNATAQYNSAVSTLGGSSYKPVTADQISSYENPYTKDVIAATTAENNQNQQLALNQNKDSAIKNGAFDGSGLGVQDALTQGQYALANNATTAQLNASNYDQAAQMATTQNAAANQYPLAVQALLGQLAQGTQTNTTGKSSGTQFGGSVGFSAKNGFSLGGG